MSQADVKVRIQLFGIGTLDAVIERHLSPITADAILNKMPFAMRGRFPFGPKKQYWTIPEVGINKGTDDRRAKRDVERGDIVYNPKTDELIIVLEDMEMPNKVNKIGTVQSKLDPLMDATNGLNTKYSKK